MQKNNINKDNKKELENLNFLLNMRVNVTENFAQHCTGERKMQKMEEEKRC